MLKKPEDQFFKFFKPELGLVAETIDKGGAIFFVGINGSGKTYLSEQILSSRFSEEFFPDKKIHYVFISFKDKVKPIKEQVYKYWVEETAKVLNQAVEASEELNDFTFYSKINSFISKLPLDEKICFVILDAHEILGQDEAFFTSLYYLYNYSLNRVSYIVLSEPHILFSESHAVNMFVQWFSNYKFNFMRPFDEETSRADVDYLGKILEFDFSKQRNIIVKYGRGLHSAIRAFCNLIKADPAITNLKRLKKAIYASSMMDYWITELLDSIPPQSVRTLKEVTLNPKSFQKFKKDIYGKWLIDLGFLKPNGIARYPLIKSVLEKYSIDARKTPELTMAGKSFIVNGDKIKLTRKELAVLSILFKNRGKVVSIDELSEVLWKDNPDEFSLWAIAQIIRRLRKRLAFYFINPQTIKSVRNEGYILN